MDLISRVGGHRADGVVVGGGVQWVLVLFWGFHSKRLVCLGLADQCELIAY